MGRIMEALGQYLTEVGLKYTADEEKSMIHMGFSGDNGRWNCIANIKEDRGLLCFYSYLANNIPENRRDEMAEYLTRANYGLPMGNFEMDFSDGEVRFKTYVNVGDDEPTTALLTGVVMPNVLTMDRYLPGIMTVGYGGQSPEAAIQEIEG